MGLHNYTHCLLDSQAFVSVGKDQYLYKFNNKVLQIKAATYKIWSEFY